MCVLLIIFLAKNLTTSVTQFPCNFDEYELQHFGQGLQYDKMQNTNYTPQTGGSKMLFIPHFYSLLMNTST